MVWQAWMLRTLEEKWQIVLAGLSSGKIDEVCRKYEIVPNLYYRWKNEVEQRQRLRLGEKSLCITTNRRALPRRTFRCVRAHP
jgi:transposase-like protein